MTHLLCAEVPFFNLSSSNDPVLLKNRVLEQLLQTEEFLVVNPNYIETTQAADFTESSRRDVVRWMDQVCETFGCSVHIFPLAVNFLDRMLSYVRVRREDLQLTAAACLLIASKLMQAEPFSIGKLRKMTDVNASQILKKELFVLGKLKWELCAVTPFDFIHNLLERLDFSRKQRKAIFLTSCRLIYLCCSEYRFIMYPPSLIASGALSVACAMLHLDSTKHGGPALRPFLHQTLGIDKEFLTTCEAQLQLLMDNDCLYA